MKSYKCQSCEFIFNDANKVLDNTAPVGKCPKCFHLLPDYSSELYSHKIQNKPEAQKVEFGENANAFRFINCSSITANKDAGHIPFFCSFRLKWNIEILIKPFFWQCF